MEFVQTLLDKVENTTVKTSPKNAIKTSPQVAFKTSPHTTVKTESSPWKQPATDFSIQTLLSQEEQLEPVQTPATKRPKAGGKTQGLEARPSPAFQLSPAPAPASLASSPAFQPSPAFQLSPAPASLASPPAFQLSVPAGLDEDYDAF